MIELKLVHEIPFVEDIGRFGEVVIARHVFLKNHTVAEVDIRGDEGVEVRILLIAIARCVEHGVRQLVWSKLQPELAASQKGGKVVVRIGIRSTIQRNEIDPLYCAALANHRTLHEHAA